MSTTTAKDPVVGPEFINLNVHKAGLDGLDQQRINQIIQEASKGSRFYIFQQRRQKRIDEQIKKLKKQSTLITDFQRQQALKKADMIIVNLEQQRRVLNKIIVHFDMDMFFAAVEIKKDPSLANIPMAVGSMAMISTSNYIARRYGVRSAMAGFIAKKLCPQLKLIKPNFKNYSKESESVMNVIREYDPNLRTFSLDEVYIDLTGYVFENYSRKNNIPLEELYCLDELTDQIWQFTSLVVEEIRSKVFKETQLTISAGISCNTLLAKVCTDINKPNGQFMIKGNRNEIMEFVSQIPIRKFNGIGPVKDQILSAFNIVKPTDIFENRALLLCLFDDIVYYLRIYLGIGSTHLSSNNDDNQHQQKSHSRERTVGEVGNFDDICLLLKDISARLSKDLRNEQQLCKTITLKLKKINFDVFIKCKTIDHYTDDEQVLYRIGKELLLQEMIKSSNKYRLIGLKVSNLCQTNEKILLPNDQLTLTQFIQMKSSKRKSIDESTTADDDNHCGDDDFDAAELNENGEYECNLCENTFRNPNKFEFHKRFCRGNHCDSQYGLSSDDSGDDDYYCYHSYSNNKDDDHHSEHHVDVKSSPLSDKIDSNDEKKDPPLPSQPQFLKCPICQSNTLFQTNDDLNRHIDICLNRQVCIELTAIAVDHDDDHQQQQKSDISSLSMKKSNKKKRLSSSASSSATTNQTTIIQSSANQTKIEHYYGLRKCKNE